MVKNLLANIGEAKDAGSIPGSSRSPGGGNGNLVQYPEKPDGLQPMGSQRVGHH